MGPIVCATRGGQASRRTQEKATTLARECGAELIFLYVMDPDFAGLVNDELSMLIEDELRRLARCLLAIARARAEDEGVAARLVTLTGPVPQTIEDYVGLVEASTLVIGAPQSASASHILGPDRIRAIGDATGVDIVVVT